MSFTEALLNIWLAAFIWPLIRISSMVVAAPVLSSRQVPARYRISFALVLTWILMPLLPPVVAVDFFSAEAFLMVLQQVLIGLAMGFILQMVFGALVFGGQVMAYSMGLGFASMMDPQNGVQVPVVSQFYIIVATLFFLVLNGHLLLIDILVQSFHTFPVAVDGLSRSSFSEVVGWGSQMFSGGLLMALPVMAALLLFNFGLGVITRAAPQLHIFAVGFPLAMLIGFILMWVTLPNVMANFRELLEAGFALIQRLLLIPG
ncbi:flagellar biosynthetic protein FliR [Solemya velesiana gill symbiont]|uniref:Flagellar biosynthetic protein FliR n=1 Tax=Solemya velesiana gill symbiont TaxID=1918948 RepID=A0A1T2KWW0_9GAMM|nr:flagellar biosynthetic protein FliR [Solemya velesiana gill symbiont]OOZ37236.1 flagellar biosynthetic protein FliR [Solemya velesiana gill symbiont]